MRRRLTSCWIACTLDSESANDKHSPMKTSLLIALALAFGCIGGFAGEPKSIFDGKTFKGWIGDTNKTWRIADGAFVGGSLDEKVPRNEFVRTTGSYTN